MDIKRCGLIFIQLVSLCLFVSSCTSQQTTVLTPTPQYGSPFSKRLVITREQGIQLFVNVKEATAEIAYQEFLREMENEKE